MKMANKEKLKARSSSGVFVLIFLGIMVLVNVMSVQIFGRLDLTENNEFSLSDASKAIMKNLDDQVLAKAYFTQDLPAPYNQNAAFLKDLFEEYQAYAGGKFRFEFIDPGEDEQIKMELSMSGIPPVQIQVLENDEFKVKQVAMGIVFYYADKKESIPVVKSTSGLEYEITSLIRKLTSDKLKTVGFLQGHGEPSLQQNMSEASKMIQKNYATRDLILGENDSIPDDIDTLVIISPKEKLSEKALYEIDQFIMKGKTAAFLVDRYDVDLQQFNAKPLDTGIEELLKNYGITLNSELVLDVQNKRINVATQQGMMQIRNIINYPYIPVITDFKEGSTLLSGMEALSFPFMSSLQVAASTPKIEYEILAQTSPRSWAAPATESPNPMQRHVPTETSKMGPFPVIVSASGNFTSRYASADSSKEGLEFLENANPIPESTESRILVVADGNFMQDDFLDGPNLVFFANIIDWLCQDESLISIRGRGVTDRPLEPLENWEKNVIKYFNLLGIPLLLIAYGFLRFALRRARKSGLAAGNR